MTNLVLGAGGAAAAYTVDQSLRFNLGDSASLSRTPGSDGNRKTWTFSFWYKCVDPSFPGDRDILSTTTAAAPTDEHWFKFGVRGTNNQFVLFPGYNYNIYATDAYFRDVGAWYHVVLRVDTTQASWDDRVRVYVNGELKTITNVYTGPSGVPPQDWVTGINSTDKQELMIYSYGTDVFTPGYLAEVYMIDGQSLAPSSFAETDSATNQWKPIDASGLTFGTNGFYQKYAATTLANSFTDSSEDIFTPTESLSVDYLVVAGGGGGGNAGANTGYWGAGGGAGAGGYLTGTGHSVTAKEYTITVGEGGAGAGYQVAENGATGSDSIFDTYTAVGGGSGASGIVDSVGGDGGSGGGGSYGARASGSGTAGQGYDGGDNSYTSSGASGGGGGAQGGDAGATVGAGGTGISNNYRDGTSGTTIGTNYFAGGGGGGSHNGTAASATYGGGAGGTRGGSVNGTSNGVVGTATSGGGGGGGSNSTDDTLTTGGAGGDGGSGIVVIRYISTTEKATGGTITSYVDGSDTYQVHTFTHFVHTITANGDVANTRAQSKVGDSSIYFDGTGDYLTSPDSTDWDVFETGSVFTLEAWIKFSSTPSSVYNDWFTQMEDASNGWRFGFDSSTPGYSSIWIWMKSGGSTVVDYIGGRDGTTDAGQITDTDWHHVAMTKNGSAIVGYVDGVECIDATDADSDTFAAVLGVGGFSVTPLANFDGYMDEIRISDNLRYTGAFTPSTTEFTADSNTLLLIHSNWDGGLGADSSGNYNTFTPTNLVATDKMVDSPTNNFATLNPLVKPYGTNTFAEGNLKVTSSAAWNSILGTMSMSSGKWYWEALLTSTNFAVGVMPDDFPASTSGPHASYGIIYRSNGDKEIDGTATSYGATFGDGDILGYAVDMDASTIIFYKNNASQGSVSFSGTVANAASVIPGGVSYSDTSYFNFGSDSSFVGNETAQGNSDSGGVGDLFYEPPSGYLCLCSSNLPVPSIKKSGSAFNTVLYTGDGATTLAVTGAGFAPSFTWIKNRDAADKHVLVDEVRGATNYISSNNTAAEVDDSTFVASLDSDGFTVGNDVVVNTNTENYVSWNWLAATTFDPATDGTVTTGSGRSNSTAGFSIVKYTGETDAMTVGHGLAQAPEMIILKNIDGVYYWAGYSKEVGNTKSIPINDSGAPYPEKSWNDTTPTASVFSLGAQSETSSHRFNYASENFIAYCFHSVEGYSKVGSSYEGNGNAAGTYVYTGFRPAFVLVKKVSASGNWILMDNKRSTYNVVDKYLLPDLTEADNTGDRGDFVSNGFKIRSTSSAMNSSGAEYIYMAFSESPFKYANAR